MSLLPAVLLLAAAPAPSVSVALDHLLQNDARVLAIGWRLGRGNAAFCAETRPAIGLTLIDSASYADPPSIRRALGIGGDVAVSTVAPGSPAAAAGLAPRAEIAAVSGQGVMRIPVDGARDWRRQLALARAVDSELARSGSVTIVWRDSKGQPRETMLRGEPACVSRFEVGGARQKPLADGEVVRIGPDYLDVSDDLVAAMLAHEMAHNVLGHHRRRAAGERSTSAIRAMEEEADRLAPWLLANAGYDPAAMLRLAQDRRQHDGLIAPATHGSWKTRGRAIAEELKAIAAAGPAPLDWRRRFPAK